MQTCDRIRLYASDVTGQNAVTVTNVQSDATVGELVDGLVSRMRLPANDAVGAPVTYHARLEREGRHLHASETVGESLQQDDALVLQPNVHAG